MCLVTWKPKWKLATFKYDDQMQASSVARLCVVLSGPLNTFLDCMQDVNKFPLFLFQTVPSAQAAFGSFQLHAPKYSVICMREEELFAG